MGIIEMAFESRVSYVSLLRRKKMKIYLYKISIWKHILLRLKSHFPPLKLSLECKITHRSAFARLSENKKPSLSPHLHNFIHSEHSICEWESTKQKIKTAYMLIIVVYFFAVSRTVSLSSSSHRRHRWLSNWPNFCFFILHRHFVELWFFRFFFCPHQFSTAVSALLSLWVSSSGTSFLSSRFSFLLSSTLSLGCNWFMDSWRRAERRTIIWSISRNECAAAWKMLRGFMSFFVKKKKSVNDAKNKKSPASRFEN